MYAVVRTGGKQYRVAKDSVLKGESLVGDVGSKLTLGEVLMLGGDKPKLGAPLVQGASVECEILVGQRAQVAQQFVFRVMCVEHRMGQERRRPAQGRRQLSAYKNAEIKTLIEELL